MRSPPPGPVAVVAEEPEPPAGWDARTVDVPGGHVLQGAEWAAHRAEQGWRPRFLSFADGRAALLLTRRQPPLPGFLAYAPRGPVSAGDPAERVAGRAAGLAAWCRGEGASILAVDPELDASETYEHRLAEAAFRPAHEIQPSRHRMVLRFPAGADEDGLLRGVSKSSRQRIRAAEEAGTTVREDRAGEWLEPFGALMEEAAGRRHFHFQAEGSFLPWWRRVLEAGRARFFVALHGGELCGGLLAYLQGGHWATAFSADRADLRDRVPGTMHLLRWTAIRGALAAGVPAIDLGGVDLAGHRERPREGDPGWGLYQHKASFGAEWVESAPAHEVLLRPWLYRIGLSARALRRVAMRLQAR
ncbi:MAG TPA: peptidoglycan bridge formation glycyltransferase FemA/FemB family protein [Candidatus Limnocylindrales bacterium]|nr:peptidoglycan bridge formation glycyltransferase FemA/FemB family protein [Candidatus Limnocylindrales bacterium]